MKLPSKITRQTFCVFFLVQWGSIPSRQKREQLQDGTKIFFHSKVHISDLHLWMTSFLGSSASSTQLMLSKGGGKEAKINGEMCPESLLFYKCHGTIDVVTVGCLEML